MLCLFSASKEPRKLNPLDATCPLLTPHPPPHTFFLYPPLICLPNMPLDYTSNSYCGTGASFCGAGCKGGPCTNPVTTTPTPSGGIQCLPDKGCNVCSACCKSYLSNPTECNGCVAASCTTPQSMCGGGTVGNGTCYIGPTVNCCSQYG